LVEIFREAVRERRERTRREKGRCCDGVYRPALVQARL